MKLFGLKKLIILKHGALLGDDDSHIDTLARFVDKRPSFMWNVMTKDIHFTELKKMEKELKKLNFDLFYHFPFTLP